MECSKKHRHNSVTGRLVLYRLWIEIKKGGQRVGEDGEDLQTHPSPVLSFNVVGPLDVLPFDFIFCFFREVRVAGLGAEVNIVFLYSVRRLTGEEGKTEGRRKGRQRREG